MACSDLVTIQFASEAIELPCNPQNYVVNDRVGLGGNVTLKLEMN